jgi:hypothetical protein
MDEVLALIDALQIYEALDKLEDLGVDSDEFQALQKEYEENPSKNFAFKLKKFVLQLERQDAQEEASPSITNHNTITDQGSNNINIQGINQATVNAGNKHSKTKPTTNILFMGANPKNSQALDINKEYRTLQQEMRQGSQRDNFKWLSPVFAATLSELMRGLNQKPHIIHFSGHGLKKGLVLEDEKGYTQILSNEMLQLLFRNLKDTVKFIVLNSCYSSTQAQFLSQLVGCHVVGYNLPVNDGIAQSFVKGFYLSLSDGLPFSAAVDAGRVMVMAEHPKGQLPLEVWKEGALLALE